MRVVSVEITNKLIDNNIYYKFDIKTTQFYDSNCSIY